MWKWGGPIFSSERQPSPAIGVKSPMTNRMRLLILEDDPRRTAAMRERLEDRFSPYETLILPDAPSFIAAYREAPERVLAISLDHDLEPVNNQNPEPGTGRDAADFLAQLPADGPRLPIVIHSTNRAAVDGMERVLDEAGYPVHRVTPYGDLEWISEAWFPEFRKCILDAVDAASLAVSPSVPGFS